MGPFKACITLLLLFVYAQADSPFYEALAAHADVKKYEPMVAFMCGRPAMHRTESGWEADDYTDCLSEAVDILDYCKKKYPDQDVRNIVEASEMYTITNWCGKGRKHCKHAAEQTVRPFRCLVGEFQSDALLVPPHCNFSHEHNAKRCMDFYEWSATATEKCQERGMHLQSFAMLQPCGLKVFTGVEYVCCPGAHTPKKGAGVAKKVVKAAQDTKPKQAPKKKPAPVKEKENAYLAYLHYSTDGLHNEHDRFRAAVKVWQSQHHEKITKMMKDWAAARKHVQELRSTDPKAAETLNKDMTERFQKMYQALEQDGAARKRQLVAIHQQRIQAHLNQKKRDAMERYLKALENEDPTEIMKSLEHYIRAEEKDRIHTINHFEHVRETDTDDADRILPQTKEHLKVIDQRVNQSLEMLQRVPRFKDKIVTQIKEFMKNYKSVDESIKHVIDQASKSQTKPEELYDQPEKMTKPIPEDDNKVAEKLDEKPEEKEINGEDEPQETKTVIEVRPLKPAKPVETEKEEKEHKKEKKEHSKKAKKEHKKKLKSKKRFDIETTENEHAYMKVAKPEAHHASHHLDNKLTVQSKNGALDQLASASAGSTFGIAIGSVAVFVIIIVAIVLLRKKAQRTPTSTGFVEVEHASSPEERHVANMQMNGYENPTYKYFEKGTTPAATANTC